MPSSARILLAATLLLAASGCGNNGTPAPPSPALAPGGASVIYVAQSTLTNGIYQASILQFPATSNGAVTPSATLLAPAGMFVQALTTDPTGQLYVAGQIAGQGEIAVYPAGATAGATPIRILQLGAVIPQSLFVDASQNLYIAAQSILIFAPTATTPTRTIAGALTQLTGTSSNGLTVDTAGNIYLSANTSTSGTLCVFASTASGNVAPTSVITSANNFAGVAVDTAGNIYTGESEPPIAPPAVPAQTLPASLLVFSPGSTGAANPTHNIVLTATYSTTTGLRRDAAGNLYVVLDTPTGTAPTLTDAYSIAAVGPLATGTVVPPPVQFTSPAFTTPATQLAIR